MRELARHGVGAADTSAKGRLAHHDGQLRCARVPGEELLPPKPELQAAFQPIGGQRLTGEALQLHDAARVLAGLQQARDELSLVPGQS